MKTKIEVQQMQPLLVLKLSIFAQIVECNKISDERPKTATPLLVPVPEQEMTYNKPLSENSAVVSVNTTHQNVGSWTEKRI